MAKFILKIEKEDIKTYRIGCNVGLQVDDKMDLVFTREALDEFFNDYDLIKSDFDLIEKKK